MSLVTKTFLATALSIAALATSSLAQCPNPDLLDCGPCCTIAQPNLPQFPPFVQNSLDLCWRDCNLDNQLGVRAFWAPPVQAVHPSGLKNCSVYNTNIRILNAAGILAWTGQLRMYYSRTWLESAGNLNFQVWRFLVNGDLSPKAAAGGVPCPVPPCAAPFGNRVRHTGYVDYAKDCNTGQWQFTWMLAHVCDRIDHAPGFPRAGVFHPDRSYSFVGPAASFVPGPLQPVEGGGSPFEDVRRLVYPVPGTTGPIQCDFEERIQHQLQPMQQFCECPSSPNSPPQWLLANLFIAGACGTSVTTPGGPFLPGFLSMGIGMWTDPTRYPGVEHLRWNCAGYDYFDPCDGVMQQEVFFGVTTLQGFPAFQLLCPGPGPALPLCFIDQSNSLRSGITIMNMPYVSDHIINLNH